MASLSKKESRKAIKHSSSAKGMKPLVDLVAAAQADLDESEKAQLALMPDEEHVGEEEEEKEDDDEEEEDSDEEEDDEELGGEDGHDGTEGESALHEDGDDVRDPRRVTFDASVPGPKDNGNTIMGSDVSLDEDVVPVRRVIANNKPAMRILIEGVTVTQLPWSEHLVCSSKEILEVDPQDDLQRETALCGGSVPSPRQTLTKNSYKLALDQIPYARSLAAKHDIPFSRPSDYYAEMVKSDEHMERVRTKLVEEAQGIKKSDAARKQRDLKKFGKQIQVEKLKQREMDKKSFAERMHGIKRKRKDGMELGENGDGDDFKVDIDDAVEGRGPRSGSGVRGGRGGRGASKMPRQVRDSKYSLGGGSRRSKQNDRDSTNDIVGWGGGARGARGGRGGRGSRGGPGGRGGLAGRGKQRPGKSRRAAGRT